MRDHGQKSIWEGKYLFGLYFEIIAYHLRKSRQDLNQGRNPEAGADEEAMKEATYWLTTHGLLRLTSYRTQGPSPGIETSTVTSPINNLVYLEAFSQIRFTLCPVDIGLTNKG